MMTRRATSLSIAALAVLAVLTIADGAHGQQRERERGARRFPHAEHAKLFISCASCHSGVTTGDRSSSYPAPSTCAACHNGKDERAVTWNGPTARPTNLKFSHGTHRTASHRAGEPATCESCHGRRADTSWMRVGSAEARTCLGCHAHEAPHHLAEGASCSTCHLKLAEARALPVAAIAAFPKPPSHDRKDFAVVHAPSNAAALTSCATCHTRESCARCHVNAATQPMIALLSSDDRVAALMRGKPALYATPATHRRADWPLMHGGDARREVGRCATCHTQSSCATCHIGRKGSTVIAQLPDQRDGGADDVPADRTTSATGVTIGIGVRMHPADFASTHRATASSTRLDCLGCHEQRTCTDCHAGSSAARRFHPANFVSRHATDAYAVERDCSSCHRTETFCRSCHQQTGLATRTSGTVAAHTGQPLWLLQHGQAARQGLTGCTSCHQQRDCLRCHSSQGLHVNPHGPGFDAPRMAARNRQVCVTCHLSDPLRR